MDKLVTIAIPTFDRLDYLKEAVASALAQTYQQIQVLISDDGEANSIEQWSKALAANDPRVRYRRNSQTLGLAGNWNAVAHDARGEYIAIIGDDDRLLPGFVNSLLRAIEPDHNVAFANHFVINSDGRRLEAESRRYTRLYHRDSIDAGRIANPSAIVWQNAVPLSASLIRTADVRRLGFKEDLNTPEIELFIRLAQEGGSFSFVPDYLAEYRVHERSATSKGLRSDKLARYLLAFPVSDDVEPYKREFMAALLPNAVSCCLQQDDYQMARTFVKSTYYPKPRWTQFFARGTSAQLSEPLAAIRDRRRFLTAWTQRLCSALPPRIGCSAYRSIYRKRHVMSR